MIIAQKTYKHKVLLLMKVGLAVFMVVIFLAQNGATGYYEAKDFVYKKLNNTETQYFLNNLNALPEAGNAGGESTDESLHGLNLELLSTQISAHIKTAVEPLLLQEASKDALIVKNISPSFVLHQSSANILMFSILFGLLAILFIESLILVSKSTDSLKLKKLLSSISPRSPNQII